MDKRKNESEIDEELDREIDTVMRELETKHSDTPEYTASLNNLGKLLDIQSEREAAVTKKQRFPYWGEVIRTAGSIVCVLLILNYEQLHIVTSKAMNFVQKP